MLKAVGVFLAAFFACVPVVAADGENQEPETGEVRIGGRTEVVDTVLTAYAIAAGEGGFVVLGNRDEEKGGRLKATSGSIVFDSGATLKPVFGPCSAAFGEKGPWLEMRTGSVLDLTENHFFVLAPGRLMADGLIRAGTFPGDATAMFSASVDYGEGEAMIGDDVTVEFADELLKALWEDSYYEKGAVLIDAVIVSPGMATGEVWKKTVKTPKGDVLLSAEIGQKPELGRGGLRVKAVK